MPRNSISRNSISRNSISRNSISRNSISRNSTTSNSAKTESNIIPKLLMFLMLAAFGTIIILFAKWLGDASEKK